MDRYEMVLSGTGGQGLILAAIMLAESAITAGLNVVQTQSYGPEARGGSSKAEVVISDKVINYPKVSTPNLVLCMSPESYKKYGLNLSDEALLVLDTTFILEIKPRAKNLFTLPITRFVKELLGNELSSSVAALGVVGRLSAMLSLQHLQSAVRKRAPKGSLDKNLIALELGWKLASEELAKSVANNQLQNQIGG